MKKINILLVVGTMNRGGVETLLMNVLRNIDKKKFRLVFLCYKNETYDYEQEIISLGGKLVRTPDVKEVGPINHIKNIVRIIKDENIDIVHAHTYFNSMFSLIAARIAGVKARITHSHNTQSEEFPSTAKRLYFIVSKFIISKLSTVYFACGQDAGEALFYKGSKFTIIDNGIILNDFYYDESARNRFRKELGVSKKCTLVLHVGRFDRQKNHSLLVDIYNEYLKLNPNSKLVLVGDGGLRAEIEERLRKLGIQDKVIFLGVRSDVNKLYSAADLFLFPSLFEGLPVTLVEAQANGLVCLVSDTIDKTAKFTNCINFHPLSNTAKQWARAMTNLNLDRIDTSKIMEGSAYDMVQNVKVIERHYEAALSSGVQS